MNTKTPIVTVLMPVYNGAKYLSEAIDSILNQTFEDFEFLIIDDVSTDDSVEIIKSYDDPRIRLVENKKNLGQAEAMNIGLSLALGQYIARMDQDDISLRSRLEKQFELMEKNLSVGLCSTWLKHIGHQDGVLSLETENELIKIKLLTNQNLAHPAVMIRKSLLDENKLRYNSIYSPAEDLDLWVRMCEYCDFANIPEPLVMYRLHQNQVSNALKQGESQGANRVRSRLIKSIGVQLNNNDLLIHNSIFCGEDSNLLTIENIYRYLKHLQSANLQKKLYEPVAFDEFIKSNWRRFIKKLNLRIHNNISRLIFLPQTSFWNAKDRIRLLWSYFNLLLVKW